MERPVSSPSMPDNTSLQCQRGHWHPLLWSLLKAGVEGEPASHPWLSWAQVGSSHKPPVWCCLGGTPCPMTYMCVVTLPNREAVLAAEGSKVIASQCGLTALGGRTPKSCSSLFDLKEVVQRQQLPPPWWQQQPRQCF